ncbi:hypothetical protein RJ639_004985 [Escallonia herrerae]|uniref:UBC core domain-containing protein n=1 Tax=Escallonia herrerae TaxID=1293975 RepID=A0AA89AYB6_9ASTE|nr:hypothetical protein RJ639_004985 [Escallonia herrerae]
MSRMDALQRLGDERKAWRKSHPRGFAADQGTLSDNTVDLYHWKCIVPAKAGIEELFMWSYNACGELLLQSIDAHGCTWRLTLRATDWEDGYFPVTLQFSRGCPSEPPKCKFPADFFHPNVYQTGCVYLSFFNKDSGWRPAISVKQILVGIQDLLDEPNPAHPVHNEAYHLFIQDPVEYKKRIRQQAKQYPPPMQNSRNI